MQRLEVSGAVRPLYGSLGVKGLTSVARNGVGSGGLVWAHEMHCTSWPTRQYKPPKET
jgi:hypothetical protein